MTVATSQPSQKARLRRWVLSDDPVTRTCTAMSGLAWLLMAMCVAVLRWLTSHSDQDVAAVDLWGAASLLGLGSMTLLIRSRITKTWPDPSLTIAQMVWTLTCAALAYVFLPATRDVLSCMVAVILLFGATGLNLSQMVAIHGYAVASMGSAMLLAPWLLQHQPLTEAEVVHPALFAVVVIACLAVSLRLHRLRSRLQQQRAALSMALEEHRTLASRDALTGLLNRRSMQELLELECRRCLRGNRSMALALLDIDHFKQINDTYGHAVGDRALQAFAHTVCHTVRGGDVLARWGGEEFVLLLSDVDGAVAYRRLQRIGEAVAQSPIPDAPATLRMTVSAGLTIHRPGESIEAMLERADRALYRAKDEGRNCVVLAETPAAPALAPVGLAPLDTQERLSREPSAALHI